MKLFLIDGHALVFKMYYAFLGRPMVNSKGCDTSILFGFTKYLLELIDKEQPTHIAVSFDPPGGTFRNKMYPEYKANRGETPQLVIDALEPLTKIVKSLGIPVLMEMGYEADDVIGTVAKRFAAQGFEVYMVTPDKDYGQLVAPGIFQFKPGKSGGESEVWDEAKVCEKWGIASTSQVIDVLALCGDSADNVPGVSGVGPVGAAKLLAKYGTLENIYLHIGELTARQQELFKAAEDHIALSKELVTINTEVPVEVTAESMALDIKSTPELAEIFDFYEFGSLKRKLGLPSMTAKLPVAAEAPKAVSLDVQAAGPSEVSGPEIALALFGEKLYVAAGQKCASGSPETFRSLLEDESIVKIGYDLKSQIAPLVAAGVELRGKLKDVQLMHYLINPESSHNVLDLAKDYLGVSLEDSSDNAAPASLFDEVEENDDSNMRHCVALGLLSASVEEDLSRNEALKKIYDEIEEPLIGVLSRMERAGVKVDVASLREFSEGLRRQLAEEEAKVREIAGEPNLNVGSPKQIGEVIFEKLKLDPKAKKPVVGRWPTDEQTLSELADKSPIIDAILEYRGLKKLLSSYIEPFPGFISPSTGRVHTTFNQALTSTGRLSSSNPNLQNIPIRTEQGRELRKAFVPGEPGNVIMSADYSQIELRIMAHLCADKHLKDAFIAGIDVHAATAAKIFGVPIEEVTSDQRRIAKTANFGIMYGISAFGLAQRLKCSRSEAKKIIDDYFASFPSIRSFIDDTILFAKDNGYVETIFGRRRYVPDVNSSNGSVRAIAERNAVNAPIQGSSADIIKLAMIGVDRKLREEGLKARMVLQVHDELVLEVPKEEIEKVRNILVEQMEGVVSLTVPLTVECNYGDTWLEAH